jgi:SecD/SecF fusion protein
MSTVKVFSIPLIKSYTYNELKQQQLALGLDLKGGMTAVLEVDLEDFLKGLAGRNAANADFTKAIASAKGLLKSSQSDFITLFVQEYRKLAGENKLSKVFGRSEALGNVNNSTDDATFLRLLRSKANETVGLTYDRLKQRIDKLGVTQPNISLDAGRDLIIAELPGIENEERAVQLLTASAKLEFWDVYRFNDPGIAGAFQEADRRSGGAVAKIDSTGAAKVDSVATPVYDELGNVTDTIMKAVTSASPAGATGVGSFLKAFTLNPGTFGNPVMGRAERGKQKFINEVLSREDVKGLFPGDSKFLWSYKPALDQDGKVTNQYELYLVKKVPGSDSAPLDGDVITSAGQTVDPVGGDVEVNLRMDANGAKKWGEMTTRAAADGNREIAIALDDEVVSAPRVTNAITGGVSSISGNYTVEEAIDFASILEVGKLPARTKMIQNSKVGPSLGKANISKSLTSLWIGFAAVVLIMLFYYAGAGVIAIIALLINIFLIMGTLSSLGTVLTLSGIAGIVLTIGMAVDANVIIFERIKEELAIGKDVKQAVIDGYRHSYSSIIDANVTTILTAMILAYFGLGPVKGFAVVLIIGVISSVCTAMFITRLIIEWWISKGWSLSFWRDSTKGALKNVNVDWIGIRKYTYIISGGLTLIGLISVFTKGFDLGVEYQGGYSYNIAFADQNITADKLRDGLTAQFGMTPIVKQVDDANTYNITTSYMIDDTDKDAPAKVMAKLLEGVNKISGTTTALADFTNSEASVDKTHIVSSAQVGPVIADDLKRTSLVALIVAIIVIFLYILLRFNKWQYSLGAIVALLHDALMVIGIFSLLKGLVPFTLEVDQAFIAAILTIIGYSISDTVIIFDRIREYVVLNPNKSNKEIINDAINSTLSRTAMISFTLFIVIFILFLFGGDSIKGFAFALTIGIFIGTYSSILIASPIVYDFASDLRIKKRERTVN